jgi:hypothetical protein
MSRVLFVMLHPGFVRYYDGAIRGLAADGHDVHVAFELSRTKLGEDVTAQRLSTWSNRITCGVAPTRAESVKLFLARADRTATRSGGAVRPWRSPEVKAEAWESLVTTVRLLQDYLRYFEPVFAGTPALRARAAKRLPRLYLPIVRAVARTGSMGRACARRILSGIERLARPPAAIEAFIREQRPDILLVTPLVELGSQQVDYIKCARRLGIRSALCVASWDNLTSKGLMRLVPDHVIVWNEAQKAEAIALHGARPGQVIVTGAQPFDKWFTAAPSRSREDFCGRIGLDPTRPFVLYLGSSMFIAPDEIPFAERWLAAVRRGAAAEGSDPGVLFRPHPANADQWRALDVAPGSNLAIWPPVGTNPTDEGFQDDLYDSLFHSAAVFGVNTSAQIEAAIVGRPVLTLRAPEFAHAQEGTLHFQHLVRADAGFVEVADTMDAHVGQLLAAVRAPERALARNRRFVESFVRPGGLDVPASAVFVRAVRELARLDPPEGRPEGLWVRAARRPAVVLAWLARMLAEDRPVWIYALRPGITCAVWLCAVPYAGGRAWRDGVRPRLKRAYRWSGRAWHESRRWAVHRTRRTLKPAGAIVRGAARRLGGKNA